MSQEQKLPSIKDVMVMDSYSQKEKIDIFNQHLSNNPREDWIRSHPQLKDSKGDPLKYIPIERIEGLLQYVFKEVQIEVRSTQVIANTIAVTVRVHCKHPMTDEWIYQDGVGGCAIQTQKNASATDFTKVGTYSVMKALPAAKSYAIKDAAEHFGKLFGRDLNRKDDVNFIFAKPDKKQSFNDPASNEQIEEIRQALNQSDMEEFEVNEIEERLSNGITVREYQLLIDSIKANTHVPA